MPSCQMLLRSLLVGIEGLVPMALASDSDTTYFGGFSKIVAPERRYVCIGSIAHWPIQEFTLSMLHDDRFFRFAPVLKNELDAASKIVQQLPMYVFDRLALLYSDDHFAGGDLRHDTCSSMVTAIAYLHRESFNLLTLYPFFFDAR